MISNSQVILRLIIAALLGGVIGLERERHNKRIAGFRTHILVCVGSALIMLISIYMYYVYGGNSAIDPSRMAASVITGIGFLGAGTIIRMGTSVTGLTTAASLWAVSGVGLAVGCGFYMGSYVAALIILISLYLLRKISVDEKKEVGNG